MCPPSINSSADVRRILAAACEGRELLFLVTPYIRFESNFLRLEDDALHARITMGVEEATYALRSTDLRLRFPAGTRFLEGPTKALGFGLVEGRRSIRLAIPKVLNDDEQRSSYRVERVGRVEVTFSTSAYQLDTGLLSNLSTSGARISLARDPATLGVQSGSPLTLSIPLTDELRINGLAVVRWMNGRQLGLVFQPPLKDDVLVPLTRWIFEKREEELERGLRRTPTAVVPVAADQPPPLGVALISSSESLAEELRAGWGALPAFERIPPVAQAVKDAVTRRPELVILHLPDATLDTRRRFKTLAEALGSRTPLLLLGTGVPQETLFEWGTELKAVRVYGLNGPPTPIFFRLVQGILKRHAEGAIGAS